MSSPDYEIKRQDCTFEWIVDEMENRRELVLLSELEKQT